MIGSTAPARLRRSSPAATSASSHGTMRRMTAPLWVPLVVAVVGLIATIVGTISGVLITQRRSDRREKVAWEREREREREVWAREDAARTFELRRQSYVEYYEAIDAFIRDYNDALLRSRVVSIDEATDMPDLSPEKQRAYYAALDRVQLYGSSVVLKEVPSTTDCLIKAALHRSLDATSELADHRSCLLKAIRTDLGVPSEAIKPPTPSTQPG